MSMQEVLEHLLAVLGVQHLGVPLHAGEPRGRRPRTPRPACPRSRRAPSKPGGRRGDRVAVATSRRVCWRGQVGEQRAAARRPRPGCGRTRGRRCGATSPPRPGAISLEAVAHAEDRDAGRRRAPGRRRARRRLVDRRRAAGQDDRLRACGRASRRPASCAARSRSRPGPRGPGGRSAGRTAPRSRRRGPGRARVTAVPSRPASGEAASLAAPAPRLLRIARGRNAPRASVDRVAEARRPAVDAGPDLAPASGAWHVQGPGRPTARPGPASGTTPSRPRVTASRPGDVRTSVS